jgi:phage recombination protein Bet
MNQQLTRVEAASLRLGHWQPRQLETMRRTICPDATDSEFEMFIQYAIAKQLDPFLGHLIMIVYGDENKRRKQGEAPKRRKPTIITTQAGQRVLAARCGDYHPAKPGDTVYTYTAYELARQKKLGEIACVFAKDMRSALTQEFNDNMPADPNNPAGLLKVETKLYKGGEPVAGEAFWTEFAPLKADPNIYEWVPTGEVYEDSGKAINRRQLKEGMNPADHMILDTSGQWGKMARVMLSKCATVRGLTAGWPEHWAGVETEETMAKTIASDWTAAEMIEIEQSERRAKAVGMSKDEYPWVDHQGTLVFVAAGAYGDTVLTAARNASTLDELASMQLRNREGMTRFWAMHKADALDVKAEIDCIAKGLKQPNGNGQQAVAKVDDGFELVQ